MSKKIIGLHGSYFGRNFGDTLILWIIKEWIKENNADNLVNLPFVSSDKEAVEILGGENYKTEFKDLSGLVFGPGGYFGEQPGNYLRRLRWSIRNYKRHLTWNSELQKNGIPYITIGVGVGPLSFSFIRRKVVKLFKGAEYISVRDKYSKQYLVQWGIDADRINVYPDVALTLKPKNTNMHTGQKESIAIHMPSIKILLDEKHISYFLDFLEKLKADYNLLLLEDSENQFKNNSTENITYLLKERNISLDILEYKNPDNLMENIENVDYVITSKLHVGIVSYALGKKTLSIPLHTKTVRFYEQINRLDFCLADKNFNTEVLLDKFNALVSLDNKENIQYSNAIKNKEFLFAFIDKLTPKK